MSAASPGGRRRSLLLRSAVRRHPRLVALTALALLSAAALPIVTFGIVPALVRSTLVEELPVPVGTSAGPAVAGQGIAAPATVSIETLRTGELVRISAADYGSGTVRIVRIGSDRFVRFEGVDIAGAPDMYVYLSDRSDGKPGTFVDLGKLKATNGSFNYPILATVDLATVQSVVVWCRQFNVTITFAALR